MGDLDDFFAKKDRKKGKSKPKFLTADELVKNLEDTSKREVAPANKAKKPEAPATSSTGGEDDNKVRLDAGGLTTSDENTEEEWKDFEEEQRKDYTGLKIGQLTLNDDDDQSSTDGDDDEDSDGNTGNENSKRVGGGPWKKLIPPEEVTQIPMEAEKPVNPSKLYVSPAFKLQSQQGVAPLRMKSRRAAPDITNAEYFPTLGAARPEEQRKKKNEPAFEEVRHGGRVQRVQDQAPAPTAASNRFQTLDDDDS